MHQGRLALALCRLLELGEASVKLELERWLIRWGPGVLIPLVFSISGEREGVKPGTPPRIERYGSPPPREEAPSNRLQLSRVHYLLPRTCSQHIRPV